MENTSKTKVFNLIILDKSGSMSSIAKAAIDGFNETVGGIRSAQERYADTQEHFVSLLPFCGCSRDYVYNCVPVEKVKTLTSRDYMPCCMTPLYDAMGFGINDLLRHTEKEEGSVAVVTIITDGMENASREYSGSAIKALVDKMRNDYGWNFAYIGTNQDVEQVAASLSIDNTMSFVDTSAGMSEAWNRERKSKMRMFGRINTMRCEAAPSLSKEEYTKKVRSMVSNNKNYQDASEFAHRVTPDQISSLNPGQVFVFGSNGQGAHMGGAAALAVRQFGAVMGQAEGPQGQSYAIDTMDGTRVMHSQIDRFIAFAKQHPEQTFLVTRIGCGIAGYSVKEVAPLFVAAVDVENIWLPQDFWNELV